MCNCSSFRENCVTHARTHARTHAHGANYNLPPASRAGDNNIKILKNIWYIFSRKTSTENRSHKMMSGVRFIGNDLLLFSYFKALEPIIREI